MPIVFGSIRKPSGEAYAGAKVLFRIEGGGADRFGSDVRASFDLLITTDSGGFFSQSIDAGSYYVWVASSRRKLVEVPDATDYVLFADLFGPAPATPPPSAERGQNWRLSNAERQLINADNGGFHSMFIDDVSGLKELAFAEDGAGGEIANFRYRSGMLELFCPELDTWHAPFMQDGELSFAADGADPEPVDRMRGGVWQLKDLITGKYRTWFVIGSSGSETLGLGEEIA